jgi:hypothetical protein
MGKIRLELFSMFAVLNVCCRATPFHSALFSMGPFKRGHMRNRGHRSIAVRRNLLRSRWSEVLSAQATPSGLDASKWVSGDIECGQIAFSNRN